MPSASQFSASETEGDRSYRASAFIAMWRTAFCVPADAVRHRICLPGSKRKSWGTRLQFLQEIRCPRKELDSRQLHVVLRTDMSSTVTRAAT